MLNGMPRIRDYDIPIAMYWYSCNGSGLVSNGSGIAGGSGIEGQFKEARDLSFLRGVL